MKRSVFCDSHVKFCPYQLNNLGAMWVKRDLGPNVYLLEDFVTEKSDQLTLLVFRIEPTGMAIIGKKKGK